MPIFHLIFPVLESVSEHYYENKAMIAWWNDWRARDQRAHIEKTFNHGPMILQRETHVRFALQMLFAFTAELINVQNHI